MVPDGPGQTKTRKILFAAALVVSFLLSPILGLLLTLSFFGLGSENGETPSIFEDPWEGGLGLLIAALIGLTILGSATLVVGRRAHGQRNTRVIFLSAVACAWGFVAIPLLHLL